MDDMMCTSIPLANTISPGRYDLVVSEHCVLGETVVIAYDKSADRVEESQCTSVIVDAVGLDLVESPFCMVASEFHSVYG